MKLYELLLTAIGLSMDAFAVAICIGLSLKENKDKGRKIHGFKTPDKTNKTALSAGLYFGVFQAGMPLIGYYLARFFAEKIIAYDHWIAFVLLTILGGKMILESFSKEDESEEQENISTNYGMAAMVPLAVATSIDAAAAGVSFAFLKVNIAFAVTAIGITTCVISICGVKIGKVFGSRLKSKAELLGGIILVGIGVKILIEHLGLIG